MIVEPSEALSIVVLEPISTLFFVITLPKCFILLSSLSFGAKPKPSDPIIAPECTKLFSPIIQLSLIQA